MVGPVSTNTGDSAIRSRMTMPTATSTIEARNGTRQPQDRKASSDTIADMITNLEECPLVTGVDLRVAEKGEINDREVMKFSLSANVMPR